MKEVLSYLADLFKGGLGYSALCTHRSALSTIISIPGYGVLSDHPLITRFIKGVFNLRPSVPRYTFTWDTDILLKFLKSLSPNNLISLKDISMKLACLLTLLAGQRIHSVHKICVTFMDFQGNVLLCHIPDLLKSTRPKHLDRTLTYKAYPTDVDLCPLNCIKEYLQRRSGLAEEGVTSLFITYGKPHHAATKDTVARWVKSAMKLAGIDTKVFGPGSCRSASNSKASAVGIPLDTILKYGTWSNSSTFYRFYCRDVVGMVDEERDFGSAMLDG